MTTYFSVLPRDIKNILDQYQKQIIINILQDIADTRAISRSIDRDYWLGNNELINLITEMRDRLLEQGITTDIEPPSGTGGEVRLIITDIKPISYDLLPEYIRDFVANINNNVTLNGINKVIRDHNLKFQLSYINNKLQIIY